MTDRTDPDELLRQLRHYSSGDGIKSTEDIIGFIRAFQLLDGSLSDDGLLPAAWSWVSDISPDKLWCRTGNHWWYRKHQPDYPTFCPKHKPDLQRWAGSFEADPNLSTTVDEELDRTSKEIRCDDCGEFGHNRVHYDKT